MLYSFVGSIQRDAFDQAVRLSRAKTLSTGAACLLLRVDAAQLDTLIREDVLDAWVYHNALNTPAAHFKVSLSMVVQHGIRAGLLLRAEDVASVMNADEFIALKGQPLPPESVAPESAAPEIADLEAPRVLNWKEMRARTEDNLAAARAIIKDAGNVTRWSRVLGEQSQRLLSSKEHLLIVHVTHDLTLTTSPTLLDLLRALAENLEPDDQFVVLDLRTISLIDASGVSALVKGHKALAERGRLLLIRLPPGRQPERIFQRTDLAKIIRPIQSLDEL